MPSSKNHKIQMCEDEVRSFRELSGRKQALLTAKEKMEVYLTVIAQQLKEVDREQDAWLTSFAFKNEFPMDRAQYLRFDLTNSMAYDNECTD